MQIRIRKQKKQTSWPCVRFGMKSWKAATPSRRQTCLTHARAAHFSVNSHIAAARHLYQKLGFAELGEIPGGFHMPDGRYESIIPCYLPLTEEK